MAPVAFSRYDWPVEVSLVDMIAMVWLDTNSRFKFFKMKIFYSRNSAIQRQEATYILSLSQRPWAQHM